eukprot:CAMPEP_0198133964 /NCGR_PEP_ID=MMETSP1442-20131203/59837_1 /TAXON_ID= /ORGANISM="Craspedostauros australis, Strain CCMP3328" /LENGTH=209 /DNA_ID=CAMNT_0043795099 /DNA_START=11 /DNA_END=640 /DNA_ORIENTATION=+
MVYDHLLPFGDVSNDRRDTAVGRTSVSVAVSKGYGSSSKATNSSGAMAFDSPEHMDYFDDEEDGNDNHMCSWPFHFCSGYNYSEPVVAPTSIQKIEPKVFLANERTFLHWLHHGVILSTIAAGVLAFSETSGATWGEWYALALLPISLAFCVYALHVFLWRADLIRSRIPTRWDDPFGPIVLGSAVALILCVNFVTKIVEVASSSREEL